MTPPGAPFPALHIRTAAPEHLPLVAALFASCPEATPWSASALVGYPLLVAVPPVPAPPFQEPVPQSHQPAAHSLHPAPSSHHPAHQAAESDPPFLAAAALARVLAPGEAELLNIAVHSAYRRRGLAEALIRRFFLFSPGHWFLEVRSSNVAAVHLYEKLGFSRHGIRPKYYSQSGEDAIVMGCTAC